MFTINIGARTGDGYDPVWPLVQRGFGGVALEGHAPSLVRLQSNLARHNASGRLRVVPGFVTPDDIVGRLEAHGVPLSPDVLKIDIDSIDGAVLSAVLACYTPKALMIEINPDFPPPVNWQQMHDPHFVFDKRMLVDRGFYGASAEAVYAIAVSRGYVLLSIQLGSSGTRCDACEHNMWFVHGDYYRAVHPATRLPSSWSDMSRRFWTAHHKFAMHLAKKRGATGAVMPICWAAKTPCPTHALLAAGLTPPECRAKNALNFEPFECASIALARRARDGADGKNASSSLRWAAELAASNVKAACPPPKVCAYSVAIGGVTPEPRLGRAPHCSK